MKTAQLRSFLGFTPVLAVTLPPAVFGGYLVWKHTGHVIYALPFVFLLACPLMHLFAHRHGHNYGQEIAK